MTLVALLTRRKIAPATVYTSGGYIMIAMQNHPRLHDDIATAFSDPAPVAGTHDSGHECTVSIHPKHACVYALFMPLRSPFMRRFMCAAYRGTSAYSEEETDHGHGTGADRRR
ncbi:MAG: hypothetical protein JWO42_309 [Chloroflexi bacterium]|nr:hypothetical protein [Chloroflexota bacterium]